MAKKFVRIISMALMAVFCLNVMSISSFAAKTTTFGTTWYGDKISVDVTAGEDGYTFQSVYLPPRAAYEMSNHMVSTNGGVSNDIPQTLMLVDASKDYTWTPNGLYSLGSSNYEVLYCCDAETGFDNGVHYKRLNLEDSSYYTEEEASHIRSIVTNAYPYVSLEQMKANLAANGFEDADKLTRSEIISAVQTAIWAYANNEVYSYSQTFDVPSNPAWGGAMHDFTGEMDVWWKVGKRKFTKNEETANRINSLTDYLKGLEGSYAERNGIIISDLEIANLEPVENKSGLYTVALNVVLNNSGSSSNDDINLDIYADDEIVSTQKIKLGTEAYALDLEVSADQTIKAVVSGTQILPQGVYYYEPQGGRDASQSLVGVAAGPTEIYAEAETTFEKFIIPEYSNNYAYIFGYNNFTMAAENPVLRCEVSAMIHRLVKQNDMLGDFSYNKAAQPVFADIAGQWYRSGIEYMNHKGAFKTAPGGNVIPEVAITRGEAFKLVCIGLGFTDNKTLSEAAYSFMLKDLGYIAGDQNGDLHIDDIITRAEFCTVYNRIIGREDALLVTADGTEITAETYGFEDLDSSKWYYDAMLKATSAYDINGYVDIALRGIRNNLDDYE